MPVVHFDTKTAVKAGVVFPEIYGQKTALSAEARLDEASGLAQAINLDVVYREIVRVREVKPATLVGQGVIDRLAAVAAAENIGLIIFDTSLTPIQQRNLEKKLQIKVIDRTALILEIFGERAQTKEGKLQVELAHLTYQRSRLVRSWTHLERQRGGAGFLGGPGETQIELDRRIIDDKILKIKRDLEKVKKTRQIQRLARQRVPYPVAAFVGYTNAGKSTLFNMLSGSSVLAQDMLFATLDPSMRKILLPSGKNVILSDTVGFISDLPHELIMAFRATLEEVLAADLVIHIRDVASENTKQQRQDVLQVLENLGFKDIQNSPQYIEVLNKIDLLSVEKKAEMQRKTAASETVCVSALTGEGQNELLQLIDERLADGLEIEEIRIPAADGRKLAWLYAHSEVLARTDEEDDIVLTVRISRPDRQQLIKMA